MAHKYHDVILAWLDGKSIQQYTSKSNAWETWEHGFDWTPSFGYGEWRVAPEESPLEKAGITKDDLLAYCNGQNLHNDRNGLILRVHEDDGTTIPRFKVVVGNGVFHAGDLIWCDLPNIKKIFP